MLCLVEDVPEGGGKKLLTDREPPLAVWRVEGEIFVTNDTCTHGQASLVEDGLLEGFRIECGLHQGAFDVRSGAVMSAPCRIPLRTYPVSLRDGGVFVAAEALGQ